MKRIISIFVVIFAVLCCFTACSTNAGSNAKKIEVATIENAFDFTFNVEEMNNGADYYLFHENYSGTADKNKNIESFKIVYDFDILADETYMKESILKMANNDSSLTVKGMYICRCFVDVLQLCTILEDSENTNNVLGDYKNHIVDALCYNNEIVINGWKINVDTTDSDTTVTMIKA